MTVCEIEFGCWLAKVTGGAVIDEVLRQQLYAAWCAGWAACGRAVMAQIK